MHRIWFGCVLIALAGCNGGPRPPDSNGGPVAGDLVLPDPHEQPPDDLLIPTPSLGGSALLNEIRFDTSQGRPAFVELKGVTRDELTSGLHLINDRLETLTINPDADFAEDNGIITVYFDGQDDVQSDAIHSDRIDFLDAASGHLILADAELNELDRIDWGSDRAFAVHERGTGVAEMPVGTSLSRRPDSIRAFAPGEWFTADSSQMTPGLPNRNPGVSMLFPLDGALLLVDQVLVDWAPVTGPSEYEVQVASDSTFNSTVIDQTVIDGPLELALPPGGYYWRVQAHFADGSLADWSPINRFVVVSEEVEGEPPPEDDAGKLSVSQQVLSRRTVLSRRVPQYFQHKDSHMLQLESDYPSGTRHAWDAPHPELDKNDPADNANCARAAVSMINGYFAGADDNSPFLTQDRISLFVFREVNDLGFPGPEFDFGYGRGLTDEEYSKALEFALGAASTYRLMENQDVASESFLGIYAPAFREQFWKELGDSIAANKPVAISAWTGPRGSYMHAIVALGRFVIGSERARFVRLNDPWYGRVSVPLDQLKVRAYWILPDAPTPRKDEDDLRNRTDTDEDGIMDFDEENRFETSKSAKDSDQDCVDDLPEIRGSVFNTKHGWGVFQARRVLGLPQISDGRSRTHKRPEIEGDVADSDGGGLNDPMEDLNLNGEYEPEMGESDPFDSADDARNLTGFHRSVSDELEDDDGFVTHTVQEVRTEYDLRIDSDGKITGTVHVEHTFLNTRDFQSFDEDCPGARHDETNWELNFDIEAEAVFQCQNLTFRPTEPLTPDTNIPATFTDSCDGSMPTLWSGPVGSWGVTILGNDSIVKESNRVVYRQGLTPVSSGSALSQEWEIVIGR